jgi:hypothetical protein
VSSLTRETMSFRTARRLAGLLSLAAFAVAAYLAWRGSSQPIFLNQSFATLGAIVAASAIGIYSAIGFFLSDDYELRFMHFMLKWRRMTPLRGYAPACLCLIAASAYLHGVLADRPVKREYVDDEADYLRVADQIQKLPGGPKGLIPALVRGEFAEDNRHPLYPASIAAFGARWGGLPDSTIFGMAVVVLTGFAAWRLFGPAVAALSSILVAVNGAMIHSSSLIACETLLVFFTSLGWYVWARMYDGPSGPSASERRSSVPPIGKPSADGPEGPSYIRPLLLGALFGLAYLTKASALFPLLLLIALAALKPPSKPRWLAPTLIIAGFLLVSWPLLTRNVVRYHNPLHSFNNKLLFAESYEAGIAEPDLGTLGNLKRYLGRHTVKEVVIDRFLGGVMWESFVLLRSLGPWPFDSGRVFFGFVFLAFALFGMGTALGHRLSPTFLLLWTAFFILFFGWYQPIASGDRFLLPLVPPLSIAASLGILCLASGGRQPPGKSRAKSKAAAPGG